VPGCSPGASSCFASPTGPDRPSPRDRPSHEKKRTRDERNAPRSDALVSRSQCRAGRAVPGRADASAHRLVRAVRDAPVGLPRHRGDHPVHGRAHDDHAGRRGRRVRVHAGMDRRDLRLALHPVDVRIPPLRPLARLRAVRAREARQGHRHPGVRASRLVRDALQRRHGHRPRVLVRRRARLPLHQPARGTRQRPRRGPHRHGPRSSIPSSANA
jgi:hypothetical protein